MTGTTCDCGRYRKVVGQMDVNISKLKSAVKLLKNGEICVSVCDIVVVMIVRMMTVLFHGIKQHNNAQGLQSA